MRKQQNFPKTYKLKGFLWLVVILFAFSYLSTYVFAEDSTIAPDILQPSESATKDLKDTEGPKRSKEYTSAYITERCDNMTYFDGKIKDRVYIEDCNIILLAEEGKFGEKDSSRIKTIIPLKDMDPTGVRNGLHIGRALYSGQDNSGVQVGSKNDERKIKVIREGYGYDSKYRKHESMEINVTFNCKNETVARNVATAVSHLITLCGGKKELF
ncbi:MAG: hypothetical protein H7844_12235 [Nitrospirae bacterium YQR-1]